MPIYFTTAHNIKVRMATMCFLISLIATVALVCVFTPKLYIILLHPERNIRQSMMASKIIVPKTNSSAPRVDSGTKADGKWRYKKYFSIHRGEVKCLNNLLQGMNTNCNLVIVYIYMYDCMCGERDLNSDHQGHFLRQ